MVFVCQFVKIVLFYVSVGVELPRREERARSKSLAKYFLFLLLVHCPNQMLQIDRSGHVLFFGNHLIEFFARQAEISPLLGKSLAEPLLHVNLTFGI